MFDESTLELLHEHFFTTAKAALMNDGHAMPIAFLVFDTDDAAATFKRVGLNAPAVAPTEPGTAVAAVPLLLGPSELLDVMGRIEPQTAPMLATLRSIAPPGVKDPDAVILRAFLSAKNFHEKDIIAAYLRWLAAKLEAYALFKVDEAWMKQVTEEEMRKREAEGGPSVEEMPGRIECVSVSMETRDRACAKAARIIREKPEDETSKILALEDMPPSDTATGRFFGLLPGARQ